MRLSKRRMVAATLPVVLGGGALAWAASAGPVVEPVSAEMVLTHAVINERQCTTSGNAATHFETRAIYTGTSTGSDAFTGDVEVRVHGFSSDEGVAWDEGTFRVRGAGGGWTAQGRFYDAAAPDTGFKGLLTGQTRFPPDGSGTRARVNANFEVLDDPDRGLLVRTGMDGSDSSLPAVQVSGVCRGAWETVTVDLPLPRSARARSLRQAGWLG